MNERYFEEGIYGKQGILVIERNYNLLLSYAKNVISSMAELRLILDFGCAFGAGTTCLARQFPKAKVVGVDISSYAIKKAVSNYKRENTSYHCLDLTDVSCLDFLRKEYGKFDLIVTRDTLEHIRFDNQVKILRAFAELLENNGTIVAQTPNKLNLSSYNDRTHIGLRTPKSWMNLFLKFFEHITVSVKQYVPLLWRLRKDKKLWEFQLPVFGYNICILARRPKKS